MDIHELIDALLTGSIVPASAPTEAEYHRLWLERDIGRKEPFVAAALGGAFAAVRTRRQKARARHANAEHCKGSK